MATYEKKVAAILRGNSIKPSHKKKTPAKARTVGQDSQRPRKTASGKTTKKASPRLMARRKKDTMPGYYPNPIIRIVFAVQQSQDPGKPTKDGWLNIGWSISKERAEQLARALYADNPAFSVRVVRMSLDKFNRA